MSTHSLSEKSAKQPFVRLTRLFLGLLAVVAVGTAVFLALRWEAINAILASEPAGKADLAARSYDAEPLLTFVLEQPELTAIHYALENVDTTFLDLTLEADDGTSWVVMRSQGLRTDSQGGGTWERELPAGSYRLLLTAARGEGTVAIYRGYLD